MMNSSRTRNSALNLVSGLGGQIFAILLKFITRTVFIKTLGTAYLGINGLFSDVLMMLSLTELGFDTAINYKLYKPLAENDTKRIRLLMKFYRKAYTVIGIVIMGLGLCLIPALPVLINDYDSLAGLGINAILVFLLYLAQSVSSYLFFAYRSAVIKADQKMYIVNIVTYAVTLLSSIVQIVILVVWQDFILYTASLIFFNILTNLILGIVAKRMYPGVFAQEKDSIEKSEVVGLFKDCSALFVYKANGVVLKATDNIVLSSFIGLAVVGLYSNYLLIYTTIKTLLTKIYTATQASTGNLFATSAREKKYRFFEAMNFITIVFFGTAAVGVAALADEVIACWIGKDYIIAQPFAILVGIEILFVGLKTNLSQIRHVSGVFRQMWFRPLLGIIVNLAVSIVLVNFIGIYGVIIGTIVADLSTNFLVDPFIINKYCFDNYKPVSAYYKKNLLYILVLAVVGSLNLWAARNICAGYGWLSVAVHLLICAVSVPAVFLLLFHQTPECRYLLEKARGITRKLKRKRK